MVKIEGDHYSFAQVGDCMLIEEQEKKFYERTIDSRFEDDKAYIHTARNLAKAHNISILETRKNPVVLQAIIDHRKKTMSAKVF